MYEFQSEWNTFMTKTSANKWRADVDRLTKCDSIYHWKMLKTLKKIKIQYVVNIFHTFRARPGRQRLRRAAVSWTVIEPQQNHPKLSFMKDSSSVHWFLAFIWDMKCNVRICSVKTVLPAQLFIFSNRKNWLFTYIYS